MYMAHVCFISVVVTVWECLLYSRSLGVLKYVVRLCKGCDGFFVFCLYGAFIYIAKKSCNYYD